MKNLIEKIRKYFDGYVIDRFKYLMPKQIITELYRQIATDDLKLITKEISVKKGKVRYTLLIVKDKNLQTRFNLGKL